MQHVHDDPAARQAIAGPCDTDQAAALAPLIEAVRRRHRHAVRAIVYYGSCLRSGDPTAGLVDFYVIVDRYQAAHASTVAAAANRLLPPNVYYLECATDTVTLRCKYAVITLDDLQRGVAHGRLSSLWGRFAQPVAIVYAANQHIRDTVRACCGQAVITLLNQSLPAIESPMLPAEAFGAALTLSYGGELRTESGERGLSIAEHDRPEYARRLHAARPYLTFATEQHSDGRMAWFPDTAQRQRALRAWRLRAPAGHAVSVLRLAKACFTFDNAIDYAAWKLERHTGVAIEVTPRLRRHPLIYAWPVLWRLYRDGVLR
ncbi:hypothetical protein [Salinisphaera hydrothermalis]|uniref:Diacylglycerol kinase catalytic region n=1 Tax=Salinisphaera hydrothermalis (strain C41B8) TaxID=1304275 RepID=A0A084IP63_SALHC|nr:hypothetical protein [Salinisphaera hydrothermalis]KEZ78497.1 diacylglycerol kinase catalytic region [Salinisphaera hydrothermalis C41B8]